MAEEAKLGYATTLELARELLARLEVSATIGEKHDPNYTTVGNEPTYICPGCGGDMSDNENHAAHLGADVIATGTLHFNRPSMKGR